MITRNTLVLISALILSACSGGGGNSNSNPNPNPNPNPTPTNNAPTVDAGADATIRLPNDTVNLDGTVADDGLPAGAAVSTAWTVQSGPVGATFGDVNAVDTTVTFASEGTYVLELTADDTALTASDTLTVVVEAAPAVASIAVSPANASLLPGQSQQFSAAGTDQYGDAIAFTPTWSATGGTIDAAGNYTAGAVFGSFAVTAADGAITGTANVTISGSPPSADAGGPYGGAEGGSVSLDGSGSTDPDNDIVLYEWDFDNDGAFDDATGVSPTFLAAVSGTFSISLRVTDADGATSSDTAAVDIANVAPTAAFANTPYGGDQGADITLDASASSDPGNDITAIDWDLDNDGAYDDATGAMATFNSAVPGTFTVGVRVTDADGATGTATTSVTVNDITPTAAFANEPYSGDQGADITLDASASSDPENDPLTYAWDLDNDGAYDDATGVTTTFNSATSGTFTVGLEITDTDGLTDTATTTVEVNNLAPTAALANAPYSGDQGTDITLDASDSTDPGNDVLTYAWDLDNDGAFDDATGVTATFNSGPTGTFTVGVEVTDSGGLTDTATTTVQVNNVAPIAAFANEPYSVDQGADISLDASASTDPGNDALTYAWDLDNDGSYDDATGVNATFNSPAPGTFTVGLEVTDSGALTSTASTSVTVNDLAPAAPTGLVTTGNDAEVALDWDDNAEVDLVGYRVYRSTTQGSGHVEISGPGLVGVSQYSDTSAVNGTTYYYYVTAVDDDTDGTAALESANSAERTVTPNGPVHAYWTMEEGAGGVTADTVGSSDGTLNGPTWSVGASGSGLDFDGVDDYVDIDNTNELNINGTAITMMAWVYPRNGAVSGGARVISKRNSSGGNDVYAMIISDYRIWFRLDGVDLISSSILRLNEWQHIALVYDGTDKRIYVNGVLDNATPQAKTDPIDSSTRPVQLGWRESQARYYDGGLDEVQILNRAVTPGEVATAASIVPPAPGIGLKLTDITSAAGVDDLQDGGHGIMFADVNADTLPDLYITNNLEFSPTNPRRDHFYRNTDGAVFSEEAVLAGIDDVDGGSHGSVFADLDNDGDLDLVNGSTWLGAMPERGNPVTDNVYENDGSGSFTDVTTAIFETLKIETRGLTVNDWDNDGDLDIFAVPGSQFPGTNQALQNDLVGGSAFTFTSHTGGVLSTAFSMQGVTDTDFDMDGDVDFIAANRSGAFAILENDGSGTFTQIAPSTLGITDDAGDGITTADIDNDGDLDMLLVTDGTGVLYRREGTGMYTRLMQFNSVQGYMGGFADLDNDGDLDLVFAGDERTYINDGSGGFTSGQSMPVAEIEDPRAIAFADIDRDGDLDMAIAAKQSRNWLVRNDDDTGNNWLEVNLVSPDGQAGAFGAKVGVYAAGDLGGTLLGMREAKGNYGYLGQDDQTLHFGLGATVLVDVRVVFLDGTVVDTLLVPANTTVLVDASP